METNSKKDYFIGLDIGTNSIGWAATDENYRLMRAKGKDLWGVRLFNEAVTAAERRVNRSSRRRNDRKRQRLQLLREIFENEINKVDKNFYKRMEESKYWLEDKKVEGKYSLFNEPGFTDKDFFNKYPTIFHLRKALMEHREKMDIRLYFLAINQMFKRRGHFLFEGQKLESISDVSPYKETLDQLLRSEMFDIELEDEFFKRFIEIIVDVRSKKTDKKNSFKKIIPGLDIPKDKQKQLTAITDGLISGKVKLESIFADPELKEQEIKEIEFYSENYEAVINDAQEFLGDRAELITTLKAIYDFAKLQEVLMGYDTLSDAQIARFNKHQEDLQLLKELVRKFDDEDHTRYKDIFTDFKDKNNASNYAHYVNSTNKNGKKISLKGCSYDSFSEYLGKKLKTFIPENNETLVRILEELKEEKFLQKQITSNNSIIPYQVHMLELDRILNNLSEDYPSFNEIEDGFSKTEKLRMIFRFRIPYYVGPLNDYHKNDKNGHAWIVKKHGMEDQKIRPWNFEEVIDLEACENEFIKRMINHCTYLTDEKVVPKSSILYSEYTVLNELNNLKINGEKPSIELKKKIFEDIFLNHKRVTGKSLKSWLIRNNYADSDVVLSGFDADFKSSMASYIDIRNILGADFNRDKAEKIIETITVHSGESQSIKKAIAENYPELDEKQVNRIASLKYADWGRMSEKFLTGFEGTDRETGETGTIMHFLRNTNDNLMMILSGRYTFDEKIKEYNNRFRKEKFTYDQLEDTYLSPPVRKMVWQTHKIVDEIIKVIGFEPKRIFIEMARGEDEIPQRKESRKSDLLKLYSSIKDESRDWKKEIESRDETEFRSEKLFLYYTQMGRCMYSGEPIELNELFNTNTYDIDHIIPRSKKKDDSILNNKVLVKRTINQHIKKDIYPVPEEIIKKSTQLWDILHNQKFINDTKFERLTRREELTDEELAGFINRQLVETRQTTKEVASIFENAYPNSRIVYVKAGNVSEFRQDFGYLKCRDINDLHHAHDAFLNIVVGNIYYTKFTGNALEFVKANRGNYTLNHLFTHTVYGPGKKIVWSLKEGRELVEKTLNKFSVLFTVEQYEQKGQLFNASHIRKEDLKKNTVYLPLSGEERMKNIEKYGAYSDISGAYFFLVEYDDKKGRTKSFEFVPVYLASIIKKNPDALMRYCLETLGLMNPTIIKNRILMKTVIEINGFRYFINGRSANRLIIQPALQPYFNLLHSSKLKKVFSAVEKSKKFNKDLFDSIDEKTAKELLLIIKNKLETKPYNSRVNISKEFLQTDVDQLKLSKKDVSFLITESIKLIKSTNEKMDATLVGGARLSGNSTTNKTLDSKTKYRLVFQSISGIIETKVDL